MAEYFKKDGDEFKPVDENLLTQTEVDGVVEKRLERERGKFADYEDLKTKAGKVDTISKEFDEKLKKAGEEKSELEKQLSAANLGTTKVKLQHEFKLSDDLAGFMNGSTDDELREQAEKLSKGIKGSAVKIDKKDKPEGKTSDTKKLAKGLFGDKKSD